MNIHDLVTSITQTMDDLRAVLDEETEALRSLQVKNLQPLTERKNMLEKVYARKLALVAERREELAELDDEERADVEDAEMALRHAADNNIKAITSTQRISQRLIDAVIAGARKASAQTGGYAAQSTPERNHGFIPVAINETL